MFLEIKNISKSYKKEKVVKNLNFSLDANLTLSVLGKSGCGKTTMLKIIAGLESSEEGEIFLDAKNITREKAEKRNTIYLYQEDLLFPHLNVFENIAFALHIRKLPEKVIITKVKTMLDNLELSGQDHKMPNELSGGQRQRVSFGRAIISNPSLLLLDEPFGSLDSLTRNKMQKLFKNLSRKYNITSIFVTHDLKEALLMGDQIGLMKEGNLKVYDSKEEFINDPGTGVQNEILFWDKLKTGESVEENNSI
ncbi:ABC transporter ATP-binding protein [Membranihabitans maritimus]|uniref:ABC transporter ATP-binding protein n=1 Tax=Membranihabitans maritimus TaxID=2904244 RepID=UPI001F261B27|nr:ABC transporter ATP-binding protein [Membranihabitans maritimus]